MPEPVAIALASVGLFLQIFDTCDRLYHGFMLTWRFGTDFSILQSALDMQWARLDAVMKRRLVYREEIDVNDLNHNATLIIKRHLNSMRIYFETCNKLMKWYDGEKNHGPFTESQSLPPVPKVSDQVVTPKDSASTLVVDQAPPRRRNWLRIRGRKPSASSPPARTATRDSSESRTRRGLAPGLETPEQQEVGLQMAGEAAVVAVSANYFKKMAWAHRDMDKLKDLIADIRDCNNDLGSFLESIAVKDVKKILPNFPQCENMWPMITQVENALYLMHCDLMDINVTANGQGPFFFAIQLFENHGDNRADLENVLEGHLRLCDGSHVFNLQKHTSEQMDDAATDFLIVESTRPNPGQPGAQLAQLGRLHDLSRPQAVQSFPAASIERWGYFSSNQTTDAVNILYCSTRQQWTSKRTLRDILEEPHYRTRMVPVQIVQLARLLLCAQLYLARVLRGHPRFRLASYRYYQTPEEENEWDDDSPLVLSPYLAVGLGRRPPPPVLGSRRGISRAPDIAMVETGLVLYQLGTGEPVDYDLGLQALQEAKNSALRNLEVLDRRVGAVYSEMVHEFLEFSQPASYLLRVEDERQASEQIKRSISALMSLERSLTNTVTTAIAFPVTAQDVTTVEGKNG